MLECKSLTVSTVLSAKSNHASGDDASSANDNMPKLSILKLLYLGLLPANKSSYYGLKQMTMMLSRREGHSEQPHHGKLS
jgi:hypothetical protein